MMKGLTLSKFKKLKENKDWADLIHVDGHKMRIAKGALSHLQRKQIESLPVFQEGGEVEPEPEEMGPPQPSPELNQAAETLKSIDAEEAGEPQEFNMDKQLNQLSNAVPEAREEPLQMEEPESPHQPKAEAAPEPHEPQAFPTQADIVAQSEQADQQLMQAYAEGSIKPDQFTSKEHQSKSNSWLGVLVSALGQAIGQGKVPTNVALDQINKNNQLELERQQADDTKKLNLWKMNRQALGTRLAANLATQNQLLTGEQFKLTKAAAETKNAYTIAHTQLLNQQIQGIKRQNDAKLAALRPNTGNQTFAGKLAQLRAGQVLPDNQIKQLEEEGAKHAFVSQNAPELLRLFDAAAKTQAVPKGHGVLSAWPGYESPEQHAFKGYLASFVPHIEGSANLGLIQSAQEHFTPGTGLFSEDRDQKRRALVSYIKNLRPSPLAESVGIQFDNLPDTSLKNVGREHE
jgi:hypothetical protein